MLVIMSVMLQLCLNLYILKLVVIFISRSRIFYLGASVRRVISCLKIDKFILFIYNIYIYVVSTQYIIKLFIGLGGNYVHWSSCNVVLPYHD